MELSVERQHQNKVTNKKHSLYTKSIHKHSHIENNKSIKEENTSSENYPDSIETQKSSTTQAM